MFIQVLLVCVFVYTFVDAWQSNTALRFLSMEQAYEVPGDASTALCTEVPTMITDRYEIDDNGYWNTHSSWGFAATMLAIRFRGFVNTYDVWRGGNSKTVFNAFKAMNSRLEKMGSGSAMVTMVSLDEQVNLTGSTNSSFYAQVLATADELMGAQYYYMSAANLAPRPKNSSFIEPSYTDDTDYITLKSTYGDWNGVFPKWQIKDDPSGDSPSSTDEVIVPMNKYSVFVAAAVNMGLFPMKKMVTLSASAFGADDDTTWTDDGGASWDDDDGGTFGDDTSSQDDDSSSSQSVDDDSNRRQLTSFQKPKSFHQGRSPRPQPMLSGDRKEAEKRENARRHLLATPSPTPMPTGIGHATRYKGNLTSLVGKVARKYYDRMDPLLCNSEHCWIRVGGAADDPTYGATIFPIIQNYDSNCLDCTKSSSDAYKKICNELDIEYSFFFNADDPGQPYSFAFNESEHVKYSYRNTGLTGSIILNLYEGVEYLNHDLYALPELHCTTPIAMVDESTDNVNACGSKYSLKMISKKYKLAQEKWCNELPVQPQEIFLECRQGFATIFTASLAAAYSSLGSASGVLFLLLIIFCHKVLGLKPFVEEPVVEKPPSMFQKCRDSCKKKEQEPGENSFKDKKYAGPAKDPKSRGAVAAAKAKEGKQNATL